MNGGLQPLSDVLLSGPFKKVSSVPRSEFHPVSRSVDRDPYIGQQAGSDKFVHSDLRIAEARAFAKKPRNKLIRPYTGGAGKDSLDGICYFAGFGT